MFWWNKNGFENSHYVILAYSVFTLPVMMPELLSRKVIQLRARDKQQTWLRVYHSRRPISWLIPEMQYPVIYIIKFQITKAPKYR